MDRYPYRKPPRWWEPFPSRRWIRFWRPLRRYQQIVQYGVSQIEVTGLEHLAGAVCCQGGVLVTPNHAGHADSYLLMDALERLPGDYYVMTAWQVFALMGWFWRITYQQHGCFSVDREATDLKAYRQAVEILSSSSDPLVIFPEGEVYHLSDRVTPFRAGTLSVAASAVRRSGRPVACVPCGLKYHYLDDPTPELLPVVERIEQKLELGPGPSNLAERMEWLTAAVVGWRERQYLGEPQEGPLDARRDRLLNTILSRLEPAYGINSPREDVPDRVKEVRQQIIARQPSAKTSGDSRPGRGGDPAAGERPAEAASRSTTAEADAAALEDAFVVTQLYSYSPGYVAERQTIERIAETVDKLEEDVLGVRTATVRGKRRGTVRFGEPIVIETTPDRETLAKLRPALESRVQQLLNEPA